MPPTLGMIPSKAIFRLARAMTRRIVVPAPVLAIPLAEDARSTIAAAGAPQQQKSEAI
ncbi:hypothetical protein QJS04_geneDACA008069 [Acorus gramineus]|uniref:Uncharacterized protein n=1 Tax=Acorus gramineus TaxID=55184 RepID=A0AAV9BCA3_ACOGR|nr:hypothetical protein QJS04_geneDACA008069 [Acorus gramineus]